MLREPRPNQPQELARVEMRRHGCPVRECVQHDGVVHVVVPQQLREEHVGPLGKASVHVHVDDLCGVLRAKVNTRPAPITRTRAGRPAGAFPAGDGLPLRQNVMQPSWTVFRADTSFNPLAQRPTIGLS